MSRVLFVCVFRAQPFNTLQFDSFDKIIVEFHRGEISHSAKIRLNLTNVLHSTDCVVLCCVVQSSQGNTAV